MILYIATVIASAIILGMIFYSMYDTMKIQRNMS